MTFRTKALGVAAAGTIGVGAIVSASLPFIERWEQGNQPQLVSYQDIVGVWTACGGVTDGIGPNMVFTEYECGELNRIEVEKCAVRVTRDVKRPMTMGQARAFTSFCYNLGQGAFSNSTMLREFNAGNTVKACLEMVYAGKDRKGWTKAGGKRVAGLVYRRLEEMDDCLKGEY